MFFTIWREYLFLGINLTLDYIAVYWEVHGLSQISKAHCGWPAKGQALQADTTPDSPRKLENIIM